MAIETVVGRRAWIYTHNIGRLMEAGTGFTYPVGIALADDGVMYIANRGYEYAQVQRISKVTVDEEFITEFGGGGEEEGKFRSLTDVAIDRDENVYCSDEWLNRITVFDKDGTLLETWGESGEGPGQLNGPSGLAFDPDENLIVVNSLDGRVQKYSKRRPFSKRVRLQGQRRGRVEHALGRHLRQQRRSLRGGLE